MPSANSRDESIAGNRLSCVELRPPGASIASFRGSLTFWLRNLAGLGLWRLRVVASEKMETAPSACRSLVTSPQPARGAQRAPHAPNLPRYVLLGPAARQLARTRRLNTSPRPSIPTFGFRFRRQNASKPTAEDCGSSNDAGSSRIFDVDRADRPMEHRLARHRLHSSHMQRRERARPSARIRQWSLPFRAGWTAYLHGLLALLAGANSRSRGPAVPIRPRIGAPLPKTASAAGHALDHTSDIPCFPAPLSNSTSNTYRALTLASEWGRIPVDPAHRFPTASPTGSAFASLSALSVAMLSLSAPHRRNLCPTKETCMHMYVSCPSILQGYCTRVLVAGGPCRHAARCVSSPSSPRLRFFRCRLYP